MSFVVLLLAILIEENFRPCVSVFSATQRLGSKA